MNGGVDAQESALLRLVSAADAGARPLAERLTEKKKGVQTPPRSGEA